MADRSLSDQQLDHMVTCGLVTHFLVLPTADFAFSIDPNLIGSLDGVTTTVVLDDGRVAIGCPGVVPEVIAEFAVPIPNATGGFPLAVVPTADEPEPSPDLAQVVEHLSHLSAASQPDLAPLTEAMARMESQMTTLRTQSGAAEAMLSALDGRLDAMAQDRPEAEDRSPLHDVVARLEQAISALPTDQSAAPPAMAKMEATALSQISERLDGLLAATSDISEAMQGLARTPAPPAELPVPRVDLTSVHKANARLAAAMGTALQRMEKLTEDRLTGPDIDGILDRLDQLQAAQGASATSFESVLQDLRAELGGLAGRSGSEAVDVGALDGALRTLIEKTDAMHGSLEALSKPPAAPRVDLSGVHQANARMVNAINTAVQRIERLAETETWAPEGAALDRLWARQDEIVQAGSKRIAVIEEKLTTLLDEVRASDGVGSDAPLDAQIAEFQARTMEALSALQAAAERPVEVTEVPAPRIDLSPLHQANARMANAMNAALQRMETLITEQSATVDVAEVAALIDSLSQRQTEIVDAANARVAGMESRLEQILERLGGTLARVDLEDMQGEIVGFRQEAKEALTAIGERMVVPIEDALPPKVDLTPLQQATTRVATVMNTALRRMEHLMEARAEAGGGVEIDAAMAALARQQGEAVERLVASHNDLRSMIRDLSARADADGDIAALLRALANDQSALRHLADAQSDTLNGLRHGLAELIACQLRDRTEALGA